MNVTDTASAAASRLVSLQVGGVERFGVRKDGQGYFAGNVGIGTSSPQKKMVVSDSGNIGFEISPNDAAQNYTRLINYNRTSDVYTPVRYEGSTQTFFVGTAGTTRALDIDSSGNLLVGTTAFGTVGTSGFRANADGRVINSSATDGVLTLGYNGANATGTIVAIYRGASLGGSITTDGSTTSYNTSSDARLKDNVADADDAANLIDALQVRKFDWKVNGKHQRYGFVAQELVEVAPEAVHQPEDQDQMMAVDYSKLVPMLVKEIQSLRARVAQLEGN
jgi:hypothetical protein